MKTALLPWQVGLALTLSFTPALGQTPAQKAATEAFRDCREMEKYGDATPCWKRWLEKHKASGSEAEVLVAEERVAKESAPKDEPDAPAPEATPEPEEQPADEQEEVVAEEPGEEAAAELTPEEFTASSDALGEFQELGLSIQVHGAGHYLFLDQPHFAPYGAIQAGPDSWVQQQFGLPELMYGGGGAVGYDWGQHVALSKLFVRAGVDFLIGNGTATQAQIVAFELMAEKGFELMPFDLYVALGPAATLVRVRSVPYYNPVILGELDPDTGEIVEVSQMPGQIVDYEALRFGVAAVVGVHYELTEMIALRAEIPLRYNLASQGYDSANPATSQCPSDLSDPSGVSSTANQDSQRCWGFDTREDTFASVGARLGAAIRF